MRIAIVVHVYYPELFGSILSRLAAVEQDYDLFVTCRREIHDEVQTAARRNRHLRAVRVYPNLGMDVFPFLMMCRDESLNTCDLLLKLHTKNNRSPSRALMSDMMFSSVLGDAQLVEKILNAFSQDPRLALVGSDYLYRSAHQMMYGNRTAVQELRKNHPNFESQSTDWGFFAGNIFWMRGFRLNQSPDAIRALFTSDRTPIETGRDGSLAHAFERVWALLFPRGRSVGLTYASRDPKRHQWIRLASEELAVQEPLRDLSITDHLACLRHNANDVTIIEKSLEFDESFYLSSEQVSGILTPIEHYVSIGAHVGRDPTPDFSTNFYKVSYRDVVREGRNAYSHYIQYGRRENRNAKPNLINCVEVASRHRIFDACWYSKTYPDVQWSGMNPLLHFQRFGAILSRAAGPGFDPKRIPSLKSLTVGYPAIQHYIADLAILELALQEKIFRTLQNDDCVVASEALISYERRFGETSFFLTASGYLSLCTKDFDRASTLLLKLWNQHESGYLEARWERSGLPKVRTANKYVFPIIRSPERRGSLNGVCKPKICVYTTLFGEFDELPPVLSASDFIDFVCVTDTPRTARGWRYDVRERTFSDDNMNAKQFKVLPWLIGDGYDYSMFVDANTLLSGRIVEFIEKYLLDMEFAGFTHPERDCAYSEVVGITEAKRHEPEPLVRQISAYAAAGLPRHAGLVEASFLWRSHNSAAVRALMDEWWQHILTHTKRDQLSLCFLMWQRGLRPQIVPDTVGTSRKNVYFSKLPHGPAKSPSLTTRANRAPRVRFLISPRYANSGSTIMRGYQLADLVRRNDPEIDVACLTTPDDLRDDLLILTKGYLSESRPEHLDSLKAAGNLLIGDFVDAKPAPALVEHLDGLLAASISQYSHYRNQFPQMPCFHVTHHADPRLPRPRSRFNRAVVGYVGETVNAVLSPSIRKLVEVVHVDTSKKTDAWLQQIDRFNVHYAVRRGRGIDGFKPFLKGFTAAHMGAIVVLQRSVNDAVAYLGDDYPYFVQDDANESSVMTSLQEIASSFGSQRWFQAVEVMTEVRERSSHRIISAEFNSAIQYF